MAYLTIEIDEEQLIQMTDIAAKHQTSINELVCDYFSHVIASGLSGYPEERQKGDPEVLGGTPCFTRTRVPIAVLFENLADGLTLDDILDAYPTIPRAEALSELARHIPVASLSQG